MQLLICVWRGNIIVSRFVPALLAFSPVTAKLVTNSTRMKEPAKVSDQEIPLISTLTHVTSLRGLKKWKSDDYRLVHSLLQLL